MSPEPDKYVALKNQNNTGNKEHLHGFKETAVRLSARVSKRMAWSKAFMGLRSSIGRTKNGR